MRLAAAAILLLALILPAEASWLKIPITLFGAAIETPQATEYSDRRRKARAVTASRSCLTFETRAVLSRLEAQFGPVQVISTCRQGAVIAGTNRPSYHRYGMAVDFNVPRGVSKQAIVRWLYANNRGLVMTYARMSHIHFDTGRYHKIACGGCGSKKARKAYAAAR